MQVLRLAVAGQPLTRIARSTGKSHDAIESFLASAYAQSAISQTLRQKLRTVCCGKAVRWLGKVLSDDKVPYSVQLGAARVALQAGGYIGSNAGRPAIPDPLLGTSAEPPPDLMTTLPPAQMAALLDNTEKAVRDLRQLLNSADARVIDVTPRAAIDPLAGL